MLLFTITTVTKTILPEQSNTWQEVSCKLKNLVNCKDVYDRSLYYDPVSIEKTNYLFLILRKNLIEKYKEGMNINILAYNIKINEIFSSLSISLG